MKSIYKSLMFIAPVFVLSIVLIGFVRAQELNSKIGYLTEASEAIAELKKELDGGGIVQASATTDPVFQCMTDYQTWPSSNTGSMDHPWSYITLTTLYPENQAFMDLNGDGLLDYFYKSNGWSSTGKSETCLYLNNGTGFDPAYRCLNDRGNNYNYNFYGDCADTGA